MVVADDEVDFANIETFLTDASSDDNVVDAFREFFNNLTISVFCLLPHLRDPNLDLIFLFHSITRL